MGWGGEVEKPIWGFRAKPGGTWCARAGQPSGNRQPAWGGRKGPRPGGGSTPVSFLMVGGAAPPSPSSTRLARAAAPLRAGAERGGAGGGRSVQPGKAGGGGAGGSARVGRSRREGSAPREGAPCLRRARGSGGARRPLRRAGAGGISRGSAGGGAGGGGEGGGDRRDRGRVPLYNGMERVWNAAEEFP